MINFDISTIHRKFLANILLASKREGIVGGAQGCILREGDVCTYSSEPANEGITLLARFDDLPKLASELGLNLQEAVDCAILFCFRNAIVRDQRGESWLPSVATKVIRKPVNFAVRSTDEDFVGYMKILAGPKKLTVNSIQSAGKDLAVTVEPDGLCRLIASDGSSKDWRAWIRGGGVSFASEPLWLKLLMKLI